MYFIEKEKERSEKAYQKYLKARENYLKEAKEEADKLDLDAILFLGLHYLNPRNTDKDIDQAFEYFQKGSCQSQDGCTFYLATCYQNGWGCDKNILKAIILYQRVVKEDSTYRFSAYCQLTKIYLFEKEYFSALKAEETLLSAIETSIEANKKNSFETSREDYPDEKEFIYHFNCNSQQKERFEYLKEIFHKIRNKETFSLEDLEDPSLLKESELANFLLAYLYLKGIDTAPNIEKAKSYFSIAEERFMKRSLDSFAKQDYPAYVSLFDRDQDGLSINPYGYLFNKEDMDAFKAEMEKQEEAGILRALEFLAYGSLGKFKYFERNEKKAFEYFEKLRKQGILIVDIELANLYHQKKDFKRANELLQECNNQISLAYLYLALYALEDDNDKEKAKDYLLTYASTEQERDLMLSKKNQSETNAPYSDEILKTNAKGVEYDVEGTKFFQQRDYDKAKEMFLKSCKEEMTEGAIHMAILYLFGLGVEKSEETAIQIIKEVIMTEN